MVALLLTTNMMNVFAIEWTMLIFTKLWLSYGCSDAAWNREIRQASCQIAKEMNKLYQKETPAVRLQETIATFSP